MIRWRTSPVTLILVLADILRPGGAFVIVVVIEPRIVLVVGVPRLVGRIRTGASCRNRSRLLLGWIRVLMRLISPFVCHDGGSCGKYPRSAVVCQVSSVAPASLQHDRR